MRPKRAQPVRALSPAKFTARVETLYRELQPQLPEVDPGDLLLILQTMLRPLGSGRIFLLKRRPDGGYEF